MENTNSLENASSLENKSIQFISPRIHGALDYVAAATLIVMPFLLGFEGLALWLSVAGGAGLIAYSLLTDYALSFFKVLPFGVHILFDSLAAVAFLIAPFAFGFNDIAQIYYIVMGAGVIAVVAFTARQ